MNKKQLVLIVEDEFVNRSILSKILNNDYEVIEAKDGVEAWEIISERQNELSAVLLDIIMPRMNGFEVLAKVKKSKVRGLPVIVTTGGNDEETEKLALEAGAWDFVSKPYNKKILLSRLKNAIARSQLATLVELQYIAEHDQLTGTFNREKMFTATKKMFEQNPNLDYVFLRLDIDNFAIYNSSFGENEGDLLIQFLADCIRDGIKGYEHCAFGRMNADVFCICFAYSGDKKEISKMIMKIQKEIENFRKDYLLEISVGVTEVDDVNRKIDEFYVRASFAAEKCKDMYEDYFAWYDEKAGIEAENKFVITGEMQKALENEEFEVYLQPKITLSKESACGAEALVRWRHPERGLISPGVFIPVFESNGFISRLDYYVWEKTCEMLHNWILLGEKPFPISVNVSRISLYNPNIVEMLKGLIVKYEIMPELLELEVTESAYISNPELMKEILEELHEAGFVVLMDDFGSGYSSLNTLRTIDVDVLKVDMKFLPVKEETERAEIILASVIKMANWLGMGVVVEGVETKMQRDFVEGAGCDCVQGFYYSKPIPQKEYESKYVFTSKVKEPLETQKKDIFEKNKEHVLLVIDDSEVDRAIIKEYFENSYEVHTCESAEEGLAYLRNYHNRVHLILIDNSMPGMTGMEFLKHCKQTDYLDIIPKIMITANDSEKDQIKAFSEGAYDYITKPLVKEIVAARVKHAMEIGRKQSELDGTTKLLNKIAFNNFACRILESSYEGKNVLMVIDVDNFKLVNDKFGHLIGDNTIKCVADALTSAFRKNDIIGRFGGDEFVVLMTNIQSKENARSKATEIVKSITFACMKKLQINVTVSIGIAFSEKDDTVETLFVRADQALYEAKSTGKEKAIVYGEKVKPITEDNKPIILICGENPQIYPSIALAYGDSAAFTNVTNFSDLKYLFNKYKKRISAICLDMQKKVLEDANDFYQYILSQGGGKQIPLLAICKEGNIKQIKEAMKLEINDLITEPLQIDVVQRRISKALMMSEEQKAEEGNEHKKVN